MVEKKVVEIETKKVEKKVEKKVKKIDIIRGRLPLPLVFMIRFKENPDTAVNTIADLYRTTVGKIQDIKLNRNFKYISRSSKFLPEEVIDSLARLANMNYPTLEKKIADAGISKNSISEVVRTKILEERRAAKGLSPKTAVEKKSKAVAVN